MEGKKGGKGKQGGMRQPGLASKKKWEKMRKNGQKNSQKMHIFFENLCKNAQNLSAQKNHENAKNSQKKHAKPETNFTDDDCMQSGGKCQFLKAIQKIAKNYENGQKSEQL